jgi:hypothetical protein
LKELENQIGHMTYEFYDLMMKRIAVPEGAFQKCTKWQRGLKKTRDILIVTVLRAPKEG